MISTLTNNVLEDASMKSRAVGIVPPPPGQTANLVNPPTQQVNNIALHTVMIFFVTLFVAARTYTRTFITRKVFIDDYICLLAYCLTVSYSALLLACGDYLLGHHIWDITLQEEEYGTKIEDVAEFLYLPLSAFIKLSVLIFYWRIFRPNIIIRRLSYGGMVFITLAYLAFFLLSIFGCEPIAGHWNRTVAHYCLPPGSTAYGSGALNVFTDIFVVFLPIPAIWRLHMRFERKIRVLAVFSLGLIAIALSITRLAKTPLVFTDRDPTWTLFDFSIYSVLELDIGLICACSMSLPQLLDQYGPVLSKRIRSYSSSIFSGSRNKSQDLAEKKTERNLNTLAVKESNSENDQNHENIFSAADGV